MCPGDINNECTISLLKTIKRKAIKNCMILSVFMVSTCKIYPRNQHKQGNDDRNYDICWENVRAIRSKFKWADQSEWEKSEFSNISNISNISPREVGDLLASIAEDEHHTKGLSEISNQIEEYFRVNFRKLSFFDA